MGIDIFSGPGVLVTKVASSGLARGAGLQRGDTIRAVNGQRIQNVRDLAAAVAAPQRAWQVTIMRDGREVTATFRG